MSASVQTALDAAADAVTDKVRTIVSDSLYTELRP